METIAAASTVLAWPTIILILISVALWIFSWSGRGEMRRVRRTFKIVEERGKIDPQGDSKKTSSEPGGLRRALEKLAIVLAISFGLLLSYVVGAKWLYNSMVSTSYSRLYVAYCEADAISKILSKQPSALNFLAEPAVDSCKEIAQGKRKSLTQDDVFNLLEALGLRDSREKTVADLFKSGQPTKNRRLANWLASTDVYYVGMPTSALLIKLAGLLGSGFDIGKKDAAQGGATDFVCRTAGIAAVMAQQPLAFDSKHRTLGQLILESEEPRTVRQVLDLQGATGPKDQSCAGDNTLGEYDLGRKFEAQRATPWDGWRTWDAGDIWRWSTWDPRRLWTVWDPKRSWAEFLQHCGLSECPLLEPPILSRPRERLNDAEIVNIALSWSNWPKEPSIRDPAILAFMRSIASETTGVQNVRDARIATNFFVGEERAAILIVSFFLALCLLWQQAMNAADVRHLRLIRKIYDRTRADKATTVLAFEVLKDKLYRSLGRSSPREILDAALEVRRQQLEAKADVDYNRVHRAAEHEMRILERSRFFFFAGLPLLPTIGFIGTVKSLIEALAIADNIPRAKDAVDQVNAVLDVTSTLSLCFSTTFMALSALLIFAPLDMWQATAQRRVIEDAERQLDAGGLR
ncbi:hypothetical protein [Bradyrhizobium japonicum]|uniref:hypothetical protein n=1 Tax=Bradyrhizobium japonicum TaxID=375 RepID=UPI00339159AF